jgi:hypothetical protein
MSKKQEINRNVKFKKTEMLLAVAKVYGISILKYFYLRPGYLLTGSFFVPECLARLIHKFS